MGASAPVHPVILAGGSGTRLWPLSRRDRPKPFVAPFGGETLLEMAWARARMLAPAGRIHVATAARLAERVAQTLPELPGANLILEPAARDTGPAAAYAAFRLAREHPGSLMALLPADHLMQLDGFRLAAQRALELVRERDALVCLGIPPDRPATGFGYLRIPDRGPEAGVAHSILEFTEKPGEARARELVAGGRAVWNAGIFFWRAERFVAEAGRLAPELRMDLLEAGAGPRDYFEAVEPLSVDRAVMERTDRGWVVVADMGWDDLGGWDSLARRAPGDERGNGGQGTILAQDATNCFVAAPGRTVVLVGVEDLLVVEDGEVLMVLNRKSSEQVRTIPGRMARIGREDLL